MSDKHVDIAVFSPLRKLFTYLWPASLGTPRTGVRVLVPFGRGRRYGLVWNASSPAGKQPELKVVLDRLDMQPLYDARRMQWLGRACRYYAAAPGECAGAALAWASNEEKRRWRCLRTDDLHRSDPMLAQAFTSRRTLAAATLRKKIPATDFFYRLGRAVNAGLVEETVADAPAYIMPGMQGELAPDHLFPAQQAALDAIDGARKFAPFLLFGCTGSGKTEVYLQAAQTRVNAGGQALILVPEIGLTPQWLARLAARFERVAVWHSGLTGIQRLDVRRRLPNVDVLIGTRSALFLPLSRLSIIIVDEEHDTSFKQQEGVHYHARDLAVLLAQEMDVPVILGSATPGLESWRLAREGHYHLLELPDRIAPHAPPVLETVDMRGEGAVLSASLLAALGETKASGLQSLLYLNRRGYAPALMCTACGDVPQCPACSLRLALHRRRRQLRCHACGFVRPVPRTCEHCSEDALFPLGEGTEKVEEHLAADLPDLRFARLDRDAVRSGRRLMQVLDSFAAGELDCLVGTQMLVKGHHFPRVALVGVVNADLGLGLPDFRAGERWWQQITQVVGRTGRGESPGRVLVQTRNPGAEWLLHIGDTQARATLDTELALRKALDYPPFARWVRIVFSAVRSEPAKTAAEAAARACARLPQPVHCVGPMPCAIERLVGRFRYELVLRDASRRQLPWHLAPLLDALKMPSSVRMRVDVDPLDMM